MQIRRIILATRNPDKVRELQPIMNRPHWELRSLMDFPEMRDVTEDGSTLLENAMKKARAALECTGLPSLGDDTGLEVDALDGKPGVYSSRYAGEKATYSENNAKLLVALSGVPAEKRTARFRCVAAYADPDREFWTDGVCTGRILEDFRGGQGFGYDPVFFVPEKRKTLAEMTLAEKNEISHRARAFRKIAEWMEERYRQE